MKMISPLSGAWQFALSPCAEQARGQLPREQLCIAWPLSGPPGSPDTLHLTPGQQVGFGMVDVNLDYGILWWP